MYVAAEVTGEGTSSGKSVEDAAIVFDFQELEIAIKNPNINNSSIDDAFISIFPLLFGNPFHRFVILYAIKLKRQASGNIIEFDLIRFLFVRDFV